MSKRISLLLIAAFIVMLVAPVAAQEAIDCKGGEGSSVSIMASWAGEEEETFKSILAPLLEACDITLAYEGSRDMATILPTRVEGGAPPDIAALANPGSLEVYAGNLVALDEVGVNADNYSEGWVEQGSVDGTWVGLPVKTDIKSIVWYSPIAFESAGYEVPTTWDEMVALMDQMVADGGPAPLSMGFESGGATGWTATDFIQDILLRTQGLEYTNGLATGETEWTDAGVVEAWQTYVDWVNNYGAGGTDGALTTGFGDAILLPFQDPPGAWMVKQSGFAGSAFIQPNFADYVYGEDFAFFPLPTPDGEPAPMQVGGDFLAVFNNTPAVQAVVSYLSSAEGASSWAAAGFDLTPNSAVDLASYTNEISADKAAALAEAPDVSYDVGDLLPGGAGSAEFEAVTSVIGGAPIETALENIQDTLSQAMSG